MSPLTDGNFPERVFVCRDEETITMLGVLGLFLLLAVVLGSAAVVAVVVGALKLVFAVMLLPFRLAGAAVKALIIAPVAIVLLLVASPILLGLGVAVLLPLLFVGGFVWCVTRLASSH